MQQKFNELMEEYYTNFGEVAMRLGVSKQTLTRKINGTTDWTYSEMMLLAQIFNIKDPVSFFFDKK